jgi:hypothetical protein
VIEIEISDANVAAENLGEPRRPRYSTAKNSVWKCNTGLRWITKLSSFLLLRAGSGGGIGGLVGNPSSQKALRTYRGVH